ncbi:MAG: response regulator [Campylobacterales bacterium]
MLRSELFYEYEDGVVHFYKDELQLYDCDLKKKEMMHIFSDMATAYKNKVASLNKNLLEIKNFVKKEIIVKLELDTDQKITTMCLGETILILGMEDGKIAIISMFSKQKDLEFKVADAAIESIFLNSEGIISVVCNDEIFIVNIVDRITISKIKECSSIKSVIGDINKIIYIVKNHIVMYDFRQNKREILYTGKHIRSIFYNEQLFVLDKRKLLIINNKHKSTKISKIKADKFLVFRSKVFYTQGEKVYKTENLYIKRKIDNIVRILIVDDSSSMREILKDTILKNFKNIEIYEAKDGHETMKALKSNNIDVMFLDWNMPLMDGEEVVNIINELDIYPDLKIIMATTEASASSVKTMVNKGVKGYIIKPFGASSIVPLTKRIIDIVLKGRDV